MRDVTIPLASAILGLLVHLPFLTRYGWFRDELYYLACARRLDWGYVDHPPLSIALLAAERALFGETLWAVRLLPALAGAATVFLVALMARDLGGGRFAQALAALAALTAPVFLAVDHYFSMNAFDLLFWALAGWLLVRLIVTGDRTVWPLLGLVLGLGLLNKLSVLWLGAGIALALVTTRERRWLATPGPWIAALIAAALFVPHLIWQQAHDWPTLEFMRNATAQKMRGIAPLDFAAQQALAMNPATAPIWIAGLVSALFLRRRARERPLAIVFLAVAALLIGAGRSRVSYLAAAYPLLLAPGAVSIEGWLRAPAARVAAIAVVSITGLVLMPLALPVLAPETFVRYSRALGVVPRSEENLSLGQLPQHYADMFGWEELAQKVAAVARELSPEERARAVIFARNYGEAGALEHFAAKYHLPRVICPHNNYWLWGPGPPEPRPLAVIILGGDARDNASVMESLEPRGTIGCEWCMPYERDQTIWLGRRPTIRLEDIWPDERIFI